MNIFRDYSDVSPTVCHHLQKTVTMTSVEIYFKQSVGMHCLTSLTQSLRVLYDINFVATPPLPVDAGRNSGNPFSKSCAVTASVEALIGRNPATKQKRHSNEKRFFSIASNFQQREADFNFQF